MANIKRENWKGRYVYVARSNGKITAWKNVKGSRMTIDQTREIYKTNNTFNRNVVKSSTKLTNFTEKTILVKSSVDNRTKKPDKSPKSDSVQYIVQGTYKGETIAARSRSLSFLGSPKDAKDEAWNNFLGLLSFISKQTSDPDEGLKEMSNVSNLREGWVYYK